MPRDEELVLDAPPRRAAEARSESGILDQRPQRGPERPQVLRLIEQDAAFAARDLVSDTAAPARDGPGQLIGFPMVLIFLRSLVYNVLFYMLLVFWLIVAIPTFLMPRWALLTIARWWAVSSIALQRVICNTRVEYRGLEKSPQGPLIVASKHQSMWETFALLQFFEQPRLHGLAAL